MDILQGGSFKGTAADGPHMPQDEPVGKMTDLPEQDALAGTQKEKEGLPLMQERTGDSRGVQGSRQVLQRGN